LTPGARLTRQTMSWLKVIEVLGVLAGGIAFAWWQFSDLAKARRETEAGRKSDTRADTGSEPAHDADRVVPSADPQRRGDPQ